MDTSVAKPFVNLLFGYLFYLLECPVYFSCFVVADLVDEPIFATQASPELTDFMNGPVRNMLGIIPPDVTWHESKLTTHKMS